MITTRFNTNIARVSETHHEQFNGSLLVEITGTTAFARITRIIRTRTRTTRTAGTAGTVDASDTAAVTTARTRTTRTAAASVGLLQAVQNFEPIGRTYG
jgi:hypothetical protein